MDKATTRTVMEVTYKAAHDLLHHATRAALEAGIAAANGDLALARGAAAEAERLMQQACKAIAAGGVVHDLGRT